MIRNNPIRLAIETLVRWLMTRFVIHRHLGTISGLQNIPRSGGYMVIANHTSNFDQYLIGLLVARLFRRDIRFLVKEDYLEGKLGFIKAPLLRQMGAIPFDRDNPDPVIMGEVLQHLREGGIISIFPEGTRGDGRRLLPFMPGVFRLAVSAGVPIVPVGLHGTQRILPKNKRYPRRGRATVVIGEPITYQRNTAMRSHGLDHLVRAGRLTIDSLWATARGAASDPDFARRAATDAMVAATRLVDDAMAAADPRARRDALTSARTMLWMARHNHRDMPGYEREGARIATMFAAATRWPRNAVETMRARILGTSALLHTPDDPVINHVMGTWHLQTPVAVGGSRRKAVLFLEHAHEVAPSDTRIALSLAEACLSTGDAERARALVDAVLEAPEPLAHDPVGRAQELLGRLARAS